MPVAIDFGQPPTALIIGTAPAEVVDALTSLMRERGGTVTIEDPE
jgi:hypothetical protein